MKGRFNIQTIVPSPQTVKPPTREGTWARKGRVHEEKERRWKEEKMRVSVAIPIDDDDDDASDDSEGERRRRDVVSAAAARLWALAEANKRKGTASSEVSSATRRTKPCPTTTTRLPRIARAGPPAYRPVHDVRGGRFAAEAGFDVGPPVTPKRLRRGRVGGLVAVSRGFHARVPVSHRAVGHRPLRSFPFAGTDSESGAGAEERRSRATHARATHARTTPRTTTRSGSRTFSRIATDVDRPSNH